MTETANERIRIEAPADRCWDVAIDFESYPEWVRDVKDVKILERDDDGRGRRVEYRAAALGKSVRYVLEYDYSDAPAAFSWKFAEGDMLRRLDGSYRFEPDGPASTRVHTSWRWSSPFPCPGWSSAALRASSWAAR
jgi:uncharacterized membrane protein